MAQTDKNLLTISLDAMGGDAAPGMVLEGAALICAQDAGVRFVLFGDEQRLRPLIARHPALIGRYELRHTDEVVTADDKPSQIVRRGRGTSMWKAIAMVKDGEASVVISAGNTGALMAMSVLQLRTMEGIYRPAIASTWPGPTHQKVVLDLGANLECDEDSLVQFAVMGAAFARAVLNIAQPRVGLLNVGEEEQKGHEYVRHAARKLRMASQDSMNFTGFVEGTDLGADTVDVIVTDGFTGNVALKTGEGSARLIFQVLGEAMRSSILSRLAYLLARPAFRILRDKFNPSDLNGGVFLGLNGLVIKSHGGADGAGFAHAIKTGIEMARSDLVARIGTDLKKYDELFKLTVERRMENAVNENAGAEVNAR
ncbi:MAG: phosphate acyltransferase PlsX [Pseudomonadota bacterium]